MTEETKALVPADAPLLFNPRVPETARMMGDLVMRMSPEEWALIAADGAARVQESFAPARVDAALAEFLNLRERRRRTRTRNFCRFAGTLVQSGGRSPP